MATSYSTNLALALPVQGELSGTWGDTVNDNITKMLDEGLGYQAYSATGGSDTITIPNGTTGVARSIYIQLNGTGGGSVAVPTTKTKMYFVFNNTASAITFKVTGQTGVSIPAAGKMALVSNGTDIIVAQNYFSALTLGSALPVASGGTGLTAGTSGGVLAYTASGTLASSALLTQYGVVYGGGAGAVPVATANGTTGQAFIATTSGAPSWGTLPIAGGGTNSTATATAGGVGYGTGTAHAYTAASTGGYILTSGGASAPAFIQTLPVANGGTGLTAGTSGGILAYTAAGTLASSAALTANNVVVGGGAGVVPSSTNLLAISAAVTTGNYIKAIGYADTVTALGNTGTAINLDATSGNVFTATLTGNATITFRYPVATGSSSFTLILTNDATASRTIVFAGGTILYPGGAASLSRTTTANAVDVWFFFTPNGGTTWYGTIPMKNLIA